MIDMIGAYFISWDERDIKRSRYPIIIVYVKKMHDARRGKERVKSHFLNQPQAPCRGMTRHKI